jgi:hypothetical protein
LNRHYVKLFSSIVHSTIWDEEPAISKLWVTMLAISDQHGEVAVPIPGLARLARISVETCESGLAKFQQPDKYSWTKDNEGRRIEEIDGGWRLLNYAKYRQMISESDKKEKAAVRQQRFRERHKTDANSNASNAPITPGNTASLQVEVEVEAEVEVKVKGGETPPDLCASQYATKLIEEIRMPHTPKNHQKVTAGIQSEITGGKSGASAYNFVLAQALDAIERGEIVDGFYFEDAKWRRNGTTKQRLTPTQEAFVKSGEAFARSRAKHTGNSSGESGGDDRARDERSGNRLLGPRASARGAGSN